MKSLPKDQKTNWPTYIPSLVFAYNSTPGATTCYQPFQLMFGRKAPMPCDNWLELSQYDGSQTCRRSRQILKRVQNVQGARYFQLQKVVWCCSETILRHRIKYRTILSPNNLSLSDSTLILIFIALDQLMEVS